MYKLVLVPPANPSLLLPRRKSCNSQTLQNQPQLSGNHLKPPENVEFHPPLLCQFLKTTPRLRCWEPHALRSCSGCVKNREFGQFQCNYWKKQHVWSRQSRLIFISAFTNTVNEPEPPGCESQYLLIAD